MTWTTPRTWTTGELVSAADLNRNIRDDLLELRSSVDWVFVTAFQNGWTNQGQPPQASFKRIGSWAVVRGFISGGTMGAAAFTLPVGFRPTIGQLGPSWGEDAIATELLGRVDVNTDGSVVPVVGDNAAFSFALMFSVL